MVTNVTHHFNSGVLQNRGGTAAVHPQQIVVRQMETYERERERQKNPPPKTTTKPDHSRQSFLWLCLKRSTGSRNCAQPNFYPGQQKSGKSEDKKNAHRHSEVLPVAYSSSVSHRGRHVRHRFNTGKRPLLQGQVEQRMHTQLYQMLNERKRKHSARGLMSDTVFKKG